MGCEPLCWTIDAENELAIVAFRFDAGTTANELGCGACLTMQNIQ